MVGYDNIIVEGANELLEKDKSIKVLFLFVPCLDDFIGTDIDSIAMEVEAAHPGIIVRACHMNPIAAETEKPPLVTTLHSMFSTIVTDNCASENAVNLCGSFAGISKECELFTFLSDFGLSGRQLDDYQGKSYEDFCEMGRSKYNLIVHPAGKFATEYMDDHYGTSSVNYLITYDMKEIRSNYEDWTNKLLENHKRVDNAFDIDEEEVKTKQAIEHAVEKLNGLPISVCSSAVLRPCTLAKALIEYGFNVGEIMVQELLPIDKVAYEYICKNYPGVKITQPRHHKSAVRNNTDTNCVVIGFEGAYLRQSDYVVDLAGDEGMYGYYGVRRLMEMLEKAVLEKADLKKMIEEYGAVV